MILIASNLFNEFILRNPANWIEATFAFASILLGMYYRRQKFEAILIAIGMGIVANELPSESFSAFIYFFGYAGWAAVYPILVLFAAGGRLR